MVDYYNITVEPSGIADAISLALTSGIICNINVDGSGSFLGSGDFYIPVGTSLTVTTASPFYANTLNFNNSGSLGLLNFNIGTLGISGFSSNVLSSISGSLINISGCSSITVNDGKIDSLLKIQNSNYVSISNHSVIGSGLYNFRNITNTVSITSGDYSNYVGNNKIQLSLCSGVYLNYLKAANISGNLISLYGCYKYKLNHCTLASNVSGYNIINLYPSGSFNSSGTLENSIIVGNGGLNNGPILFNNTNQYLSSNKSCIYNFSNTVYTNISGSYININPKFVNAVSGDLRLDVNSPCACAADQIETILSNLVTDIIPTNLSSSAIKFFETYDRIYASAPSGLYIVGDGKAVYFQADPSLINNMNIEINKQYKVTGSGMTVQSFKSDIYPTVGYSDDYKLIPYVEKPSNKTKYYVIPYTIFSFNDIVNSIDATIQNIEVSGKFKLKGFTRDNYKMSDSTPLYWMGEEYNNFLYGYSAINNAKKVTYPLFPLSSEPQSVVIPSLVTTAGYITTNNIYIDDHFESKQIAIDNNDSTFQFISYEKDTTKKVQALGTMGDWLVILNSDFIASLNKTQHDISFYNKYESNLFINPIVNINELEGLNNVNVGDITFNDIGNLLVSVSGYINMYNFFYDYALATRTPGTIKTTLLFRENYVNGVDI